MDDFEDLQISLWDDDAFIESLGAEKDNKLESQEIDLVTSYKTEEQSEIDTELSSDAESEFLTVENGNNYNSKKDDKLEIGGKTMSLDNMDNLHLQKEEIQENSFSQDEISFEAALSELDSIVENLQRSDLPLDKSMLLFRRGTKLVEFCRNKLDLAEQEVKELLANDKQVDYEILN